MFNRSKSPSPREASRPLSSLRDPSTFAPPPKRIGSGSTGSALSSALSAPAAVKVAAEAEAVAPPYRYQASPASLPAQKEGVADATHHQLLNQVDTTGLSASNLPPPIRRDGTGIQTIGPTPRPAVPGNKPQPPALPPRLPPRSLTSRPTYSSPAAAAAPPPVLSPADMTGRLTGSAVGIAQLQPRLSRLPPGLPLGRGASASSSNATNSRASPSSPEVTTCAQTHASLCTAAQLQKDLSSVAMSDARSTVSPASYLCERHGGHLATELHGAGRANERYGVGSRLDELAGSGVTSMTSAQESAGQSQASESDSLSRLVTPLGSLAVATGASSKKKPPPPTPPKRRGVTSGSSAVADAGRVDAPPPVPISTKPTF